MASSNGTPIHRTNDGLTLRQAALVAGFTYLTGPVIYSETVWSKLVIVGNIEQTVANLSGHSGQFAAIIFCYFINFIGDIVMAWALYPLLAPCNRALSLLASWFQLVFAAVALGGTLNLFTVYRLLHTPEYLTLFGPGPLHAQVSLLLHTFRYDFSVSLILFGIHLILVGYLIVRSGYIPRLIGVLLVINGVGWIVDSASDYLFPNAPLGYLSITFAGEIVFMLWLLIRGWKIPEPTAAHLTLSAES